MSVKVNYFLKGMIFMAQEKLLPQVAAHDLFGQFRFIKTDNGEIYFAAVDVAKVLGIKKVRNTIANFPDNEKMTVNIMGGHSGKRGGARSLVFINEPGLYRLIFHSHRPEAEKFQDWVYHEVLPSIRKTGSYNLNQPKEISFDEATPLLEEYFAKNPNDDFDLTGASIVKDDEGKPTIRFHIGLITKD